MVKEPALIPTVEILENTERRGGAGESVLIIFNNFFISTHDQQEHTKHKFILESQLGKPLILPITAKLYLQIVSVYYYKQGWYYTLFTNNYWKEATTPWFIIYN